ncbi:hypothetical protein RPMA_02280 [Tardiphaga alba]|uniref:Uncharacterized protein n=1 Tax=Tardiphaga alba TaxID=340268 RepID=A0ABX8A3L2_9BRAD|nr:hypothetical protein [Tardiphaga alba]QUS37821.1 hypothetical protein RPMA_02280 [Tardiphaga alba]
MRRLEGTDNDVRALKPFDLSPPTTEQCIDKVYRAFDHYPIDWGWCSQCFGPDDKARMRPHANSRTAPAEAFSAIYNEHPNCSGGETTFLHWLPRAVELQFLATSIDPSLTIQMFRLGMIAWPDSEAGPLRQLFCRLALDWWTNGSVAPLALTPAHGHPIHVRTIGPRLCEALCALRVDMGSVARAMLAIDTPTAWWSLLDAFKSRTILDDLVYYVLHDGEDETTFRNARAALDRSARLGVSRSITREMLVAKWEQVHASAPALADAISDAETFFDVYNVEQSDADIAADLNAIELAHQCRSRH